MTRIRVLSRPARMFPRNIAASLTVLMLGVTASDALAGSTSLGGVVTFDRDAEDLGTAKDTKVELDASHTFDTGIILGGSAVYSDTAASDSATLNLEGTIGYRIHVNDALSLLGSAGLGEHFQVSGSGEDFPYYVFRGAADLKLNETVTWNAVAFRYRDAFDASNNYLTPQLATGLTFKVSEHNSISGKFEYNWKDWHPDSVGVAIGYKYTF